MNFGRLMNNAGKGNYLKQEAIENVVRYVLREQKKKRKGGDLILWGAIGAPEWGGIQPIIESFKEVQKMHTRKGEFGRYIDHELYAFTDEAVKAIDESNADLEYMARQMADDFFQDGTQVVYAVHGKEEEEGGLNLHIHFAINTVNYRTGRKRRENKTDTQMRSDRMSRIVQENVQKVSNVNV